jgi:hypothetical protein
MLLGGEFDGMVVMPLYCTLESGSCPTFWQVCAVIDGVPKMHRYVFSGLSQKALNVGCYLPIFGFAGSRPLTSVEAEDLRSKDLDPLKQSVANLKNTIMQNVDMSSEIAFEMSTPFEVIYQDRANQNSLADEDLSPTDRLTPSQN